MKAPGLNQAYTYVVKITYQLLYRVNMFIWIDNGKCITNIENDNILRIFINIHGYFLDLVSSK